MKTLMLAFCILGLTACATPGKVWVVSQSEKGGVLGYQMHDDTDDEINKKLAALVPCPGKNKILSDELRSKDYVYTALTQVQTNTKGRATAGTRRADYSEHSTTSVPTQQTGTTYWREVTYVCN